MEREQAKLILSAQRPGGVDAVEEPLLAEALAVMESDPELAEWFAAEMAADEAVRDSLRTIEPPAHLREAILAAAKVTAFPVSAPRKAQPIWWALAASVIVVLGVGFLFFPRPGRLDTAKLDALLPQMTSIHEHSFASKEGDITRVRGWLAEHGGAQDFAVPDGLVGKGAVGCEIASIEGAKVSILCFHLGGGQMAHLYVVDRSQLSNPPPPNTPEMKQMGEYAVASWSSGSQSYFLARRGDAESVRGLL